MGAKSQLRASSATSNKSTGSQYSVNLSSDSSVQGGYVVRNPEEEEEKQSSKVGAYAKQPTDALMIKYGLKNAIEAQKKFIELKQERKELRVKLDEFQRNFESTHNRKIKYTKDVAPVASDFKRYKDLKVELGKFEQMLPTLAK